jgi:ubiquinone/menaquinone biosynthesis C-methylase UbiE
MKQTTKKYIKKTVQFYDRNTDQYIKNTRKLQDKEWIIKFASLLPKKAKMLDIGCAFGRDCQFFVRKGFNTYGIDLSKQLIKKAKQLVKGANFLVMDMLTLRFSNSYFDGIWCSATLIHLKKVDVPRALQEMNRVLKKNGILYINLKLGAGEKFIKDKRYGGQEKFYSYFSQAEIKKYLTKGGFQIKNFKKETKTKKDYNDRDMLYLISTKV